MLSTAKLAFRAPLLMQSIKPLLRPTQFSGQAVKFTNRSGAFKSATTKSRSLKDIIMAPAGESAFSMGKGLVAGGSVFALGSLCYYGMGMSKETGIIDNAKLWPEYVKTRVRDTYMFFGSSILVTAGSAFAVFQNPTLLNLMAKNSMMSFIAITVAVVGAGMITRSIPYKEGFGVKHLAWLGHCALIGGVVAPLCLLGGPIMFRAALYTGGIVASLSTLAACAPSEKYLAMGGPLAIGLGCVIVSSLGSMFLAPTTALGAGLHSISLYGGLALFSGFLLYDTQQIVHRAERYPPNAVLPYDPINASMGIYIDSINIFIRMAILLSGGGGGKRK